LSKFNNKLPNLPSRNGITAAPCCSALSNAVD
jgi:hypothetical protein